MAGVREPEVSEANGYKIIVQDDEGHRNVVPVELGEISIKARDKKLKPSDMQGGCITISSLGGIGGTKFTRRRQLLHQGTQSMSIKGAIIQCKNK